MNLQSSVLKLFCTDFTMKKKINKLLIAQKWNIYEHTQDQYTDRRGFAKNLK